jgi:hypothetical protein
VRLAILVRQFDRAAQEVEATRMTPIYVDADGQHRSEL